MEVDRANDALREEIRAALVDLSGILADAPEATYRLLNAVRHLRVLIHLTILDEGRRAMVSDVLRQVAKEVVNGGPSDPGSSARRVRGVAERI